MKNIKDSKGITLSILMVTIVILILISGIGIYGGTNLLKASKNSKLYTELNMVQNVVLQKYAEYKTTRDETNLLGIKMNKTEVESIANEIGITLVNIPSTYKNADYYKLDKQALEAIGIKKAEDEYIVNYVSGEVINITKKKNEDNQPLYVVSDSFYNN